MSASSDHTGAAGRQPSAALLIHLLICVLFIVLGIVVAWQRSLIPFELHGKITQFVAVEVEQPGVDDFVEFHIGADRYPTINSSLRCIVDGAEVNKPAWTRDLIVDGRPCTLPVPRQALADTVIPAGLLVLTVIIVPAVSRRARSIVDPPDRDETVNLDNKTQQS